MLYFLLNITILNILGHNIIYKQKVPPTVSSPRNKKGFN